MRSISFWLVVLMAMPIFAQTPSQKDEPFVQDYAVRYSISPQLQGAQIKQMLVDRNDVVLLLTSHGMARVSEGRIVPDRRFRPLSRRTPISITLVDGEVFYLYLDRLLSNARAGRWLFHLPRGKFFGVYGGVDDAVLLVAPDSLRWQPLDGTPAHTFAPPPGRRATTFSGDGLALYAFYDSTLYRFRGTERQVLYRHPRNDVTALAVDSTRIYVGTGHGFLILKKEDGRVLEPLVRRVPWPEVTCLLPSRRGLWVGTRRGAFLRKPDGSIDYYASRRWLPSDRVLELAEDSEGDLWVRTPGGVGEIVFRPMTLAQKAQHYQKILRQRHIRLGFCGENLLRIQGDPSSGEIWDSDNDGLWSAMYMAAEGFRYAVTHDPRARRNAWETFAALQRSETINPIDGFFARSFERIGLKFNQRNIWHPTPDGEWVWKGTTSSDELVGHIFGYAVLWETVAKTAAEKERIQRHVERIMDHILRHDFYLVDIDGKPTLWGRWNPEYINNIPKTVGDRRLNSVEIIAALQFAYHISGKTEYRDAAFRLLEKHHYLDNIMNSMRNLRYTDHPLGDGWNHSDDELAFLSYWSLYRFAFNDELRRKFAQTIRDHWEIERVERNPLWNFIYASTGAKAFDLDGALWTLRQFPWDLIDWRVENSHRKDLTLLPKNFRNEQSRELLPPDERRLMRWNGNPFILDGGSGGWWEAAGEVYLLPYWMGRYLGAIQ